MITGKDKRLNGRLNLEPSLYNLVNINFKNDICGFYKTLNEQAKIISSHFSLTGIIYIGSDKAP